MAVRAHIPDGPDAFRYISICTGGGGLDLGFELAIPAARPACMVEREAFAVAHLVAAMQAGFMAPAPIWSDVRTFDGRGWRGIVDGLIAGIPCQPHSTAGKRQGSNDERDLWSSTRRIIAQCRPWLVLIENVAGMLSAGDDEIAGAERVRRDLHRFGYEVEVGLFTAAETSAPHERKRVFILALSNAGRCRHAGWTEGAQWKSEKRAPPQRPGGDVANTGGERSQGNEQPGASQEWDREAPSRSASELRRAQLGNANSARRSQTGGRPAQSTRPKSEAGSRELGDTSNSRHDRDDRRGTGQEPENRREPMGNPESHDRRGELQPGSKGGRRPGLARTDSVLGDTESSRGGRISGGREERQADPDAGWSIPLFPPGPNEQDEWAIIAERAPHLEPAVRRVADGVAAGVDNTRVDELRMLGNGVLPLEAAYGIRSLGAAHLAAGTHQAAELVRMMRALA